VKNETLSKENALRYLQLAEIAWQKFKHSECISYLDIAENLDTHLVFAFKIRCKVLLAQSRFTEVENYAKKKNLGDEWTGNILALRSTWNRIEELNTKDTTLERLMACAKILKAIESEDRADIYEHFVYERLMAIKELKGQEETLKSAIYSLIALDNPRVTELRMNFDPVTGNMDLSLNPALDAIGSLRALDIHTLNLEKTRVARIDVLSEMPIESLNLSGTQVSDLSPLENKEMLSLNISFTRISKLPAPKNFRIVMINVSAIPIREMNAYREHPVLRKITTAPGQFSPEAKASLGTSIEIMEGGARMPFPPHNEPGKRPNVRLEPRSDEFHPRPLDGKRPGRPPPRERP